MLSSRLGTEPQLHQTTRQKDLSKTIDDRVHKAMLKDVDTSTYDKARPRAISQEGAGEWLNSVPSHALGTSLTPPMQFNVAIKWWLGMSCMEEHRCPACTEVICDKRGIHALLCQRAKRERLVSLKQSPHSIYFPPMDRSSPEMFSPLFTISPSLLLLL